MSNRCCTAASVARHMISRCSSELPRPSTQRTSSPPYGTMPASSRSGVSRAPRTATRTCTGRTSGPCSGGSTSAPDPALASVISCRMAGRSKSHASENRSRSASGNARMSRISAASLMARWLRTRARNSGWGAVVWNVTAPACSSRSTTDSTLSLSPRHEANDECMTQGADAQAIGATAGRKSLQAA